MKALTDKIIEIFERRSYEAFNDFEKRALNNAIETIKRVEREAEFEEIARLIMKYLAQKHHPHTSAIITSTRAELFRRYKGNKRNV